MEREEAIRRLDEGLIAYLGYATGYAPGGEVLTEDGLIMVAGAHANPRPYLNAVLRIDNRLAADEVVERAQAFFTPRKRSFILWARDHADQDIDELAQAHGFSIRGPEQGMPGMIRDEKAPFDPIEGAEIRTVEDEQAARDYLIVIGSAYDMDGAPEQIIWQQFLYPRALLDPDVIAHVAYYDGKPAAGSMALLVGDNATHYWSATAKWAGGHGLGTACGCSVINAVFDAGATTSSGQSSQVGAPRWDGIGSGVVTYYRNYLVSRVAART
jgi:hypothetical protein